MKAQLKTLVVAQKYIIFRSVERSVVLIEYFYKVHIHSQKLAQSAGNSTDIFLQHFSSHILWSTTQPHNHADADDLALHYAALPIKMCQLENWARFSPQPPFS